MRNSADRAKAAAEIIINNKALYTRTGGEPFFFSSGWASPIFIDCKKLISSPNDRSLLVQMALESIAENLDMSSVDFVTGCELSGVPFATLIAENLRKPLVLARNQSKGFGRLSQFEGTFDIRQTTILVDDLATDGTSESVFYAALKRAEANVLATFALISFDIFPTDHRVLSLADMRDIVDCAESHDYLGARELEEVHRFIEDPADWSRQNGGIAAL